MNLEENEDDIQVPPNLKKLLLSEVDLIRDAFSVLLVFVEGGIKTGAKFLEELDNTKPNNDESNS